MAALTRGLRNNNPGNIEFGSFAKKYGATGSDGRFAIFPTMVDGIRAIAELLIVYSVQPDGHGVKRSVAGHRRMRIIRRRISLLFARYWTAIKMMSSTSMILIFCSGW
jgi:hypothetical protein